MNKTVNNIRTSAAAAPAVKKAVLAGNPNSGKTTLFNFMTGSDQFVGNWPGVTVDYVTGKVRNPELKITDLPGLYSLSPFSPEETVARKFLLNCEYDIIINVLDASHPERSLSLTLELMSFGKPMVIALNKSDLAAKDGLVIDTEALSRELKVPVVAVCASDGTGVKDLYAALDKACKGEFLFYGSAVNNAVKKLIEMIVSKGDGIKADASELPVSEMCSCGCRNNKNLSCEAEADFTGRQGFAALSLLQNDREFKEKFAEYRDITDFAGHAALNISSEEGLDTETLIAKKRFDRAEEILKLSTSRKDEIGAVSRFSEAADRIVTNKYLALPFFFAVIWAVYYISVSTVGTWGTDYANDVIFGTYAVEYAESFLSSAAAPEWLRGFIVDGVIGGVGAVLGFLPQMVVLFILLSLLEQSGYMTRVAFILDRIFRSFGLSGRSIIPLVVATGCGVPAIMAAGASDNINEKRITAVTATFMPCSAKLPILAVIAASFFPESSLIAPGVYFLAIFSVVFASVVMKKNAAFKEEVSPFITEMPDYTLPSLRNTIRSAYDRSKAFVTKAGTIIFATVTLIWFLSSFGFTDEGFGMTDTESSILAAIGTSLAFIFTPLGFGTWHASVSVITGLLAKENVAGTMAVLAGVGDAAEDDPSLAAALQGEFAGSAAALSFLIFNLFSTPCIAALGALRRQLQSGRIFAKAVVFMLTYAYGLSFVVYQFYGLFTGELQAGIGTFVAVAISVFAVYLILRKDDQERPSLVIRARQV